MKKSNLRKIIRESIKELITEQNPNLDGTPIASNACHLGLGGSGGSSRRVKVNDNGTIRNPQVGDAYCMNIGQGHNSWQNLQSVGCKWKITAIGNQCDGCPPPIGLGLPNGMCKSKCNQTPRIIDLNDCADPGCAGPNQMAGITHCNQAPNTNTSAGSCNPNAWSNHANWTSTFTNTVANHNNPCNFLNQKIAQFTANLQGTGQGGYQNIQNCKLDLANDLHAQNNC